MRMRVLVAVGIAIGLAGCTSVQVKPVATTVQLHNVCIVDNPKVLVSDFISVLRAGFSRHNIATTIVTQEQSGRCVVTLTYTALRSWDLKPYLSHVELRLWQGGRQIGYAEYHINGGAGFDVNFTKYRGTKAKMDPVIDKLLAGQSGG